MKICYLDESGCCGTLPHATSDVQPALVIGALIVDAAKLHEATLDLIHLKHRFFPGASPDNTTYLGRILGEVKGSDLRKDFCGGHRKRRATRGFLNGIMKICQNAETRFVGRVWIKSPGAHFKGRSVYAVSLQRIASHFQRYLEETNDFGIIVADSRTAGQNSQMSHSIFTRKFKSGGDEYNRIVDLPTFGHSDNHAGLQLVDVICSAIVFPLAVETFCKGHIQSIHLRTGYNRLKVEYAPELNGLLYRYGELNGRSKGGLVVSDAIQQRPSRLLFDVPARIIQQPFKLIAGGRAA